MSLSLLPDFVMDRPRTPARPRGVPVWALVAALVLLLLGGPALCYLWLGAPRDPASEAAPVRKAGALQARAAMRADALAPTRTPPLDDADGWQAQGRSQAAAGRHGLAVASFTAAELLRPDDANLLADHAFSAAVLDPQGLTGEASRLVERALQVDAKNAKALALAGSLAVDRKDYAAAVRYWEQLARAELPDSALARQARLSIVQAQRLAGAPAGFMRVVAANTSADAPRTTP